MKRTVKRAMALLAVVVIVPLLLPGCIVWLEDDWCANHPPQMATLHVYVLDYYTGAPISWAQVELYERDWWNWDYIGRWPVNAGGYATLFGGYLYYDDCGGAEEEDFRVAVYAGGYYSDYYDIELSYYHPWETLTFYMLPQYGVERSNTEGTVVETSEPLPEEGTFHFPDDESTYEHTAKVVLGEEAASPTEAP